MSAISVLVLGIAASVLLRGLLEPGRRIATASSWGLLGGAVIVVFALLEETAEAILVNYLGFSQSASSLILAVAITLSLLPLQNRVLMSMASRVSREPNSSIETTDGPSGIRSWLDSWSQLVGGRRKSCSVALPSCLLEFL